MSVRRRRRQETLNRFIRERIREARRERDMSQQTLARSLSKKRVAISDLERGRVEASAADLSAIAVALEKPITYFYPRQLRGIDIAELSPKEKELIHFFRLLGDEALEDLTVKQLRGLAGALLKQKADDLNRKNGVPKARIRRL